MREVFENISPSCLVLFVITVGCVIGSIKIFKASLGLGGVLLASVLAGFFAAPLIASEEFNLQMSFLSSLGSSLFVSAIGLAAGRSINLKNKKSWRAAAVGFGTVFITFSVMLIIIKTDITLGTSEMLGVFCGALTTTPALSAVCELESTIQQDAVVGYSCGYLPGVFIALAACSFFSMREDERVFLQNKTQKTDNESNTKLLIQIGAVVLLGNILSLVSPLGQSGGILLSGIAVGVVLEKCFCKHAPSSSQLSQLRVLGLAMFFVGVGVPAGTKLAMGARLELLLYALLLSIIAVTCAFALSRLLFPKNKSYVSSLIAGSMTSTPCCVLLEQDKKCFDAGAYSLAYVSALCGAVFLVRLFNAL